MTTPRPPRFLAAIAVPDPLRAAFPAPNAPPALATFPAAPGKVAAAPLPLSLPRGRPAAVPLHKPQAAASPSPFDLVAPQLSLSVDVGEVLAERDAHVEAIRIEASARLVGAVEALQKRGEKLAEEAAAEALDLAFVIARRILEQEIRSRPDAIFSLIQSALRRAGDSRKIVLRLHPTDAAVVAQAGQGTGNLSLAPLQVIEDPTLAPGDCVVESDAGRVDGRLEARLTEIRRAVALAAQAEESAA